MSRDQFRAQALTEIRAGAPYYGQQFIDHRDGTVYDVTRWLNTNDIACDGFWRPGDPGYRQAYQRAALNVETLHYPREAQSQAAIDDGTTGIHEDAQVIKHGEFSPLETWAGEASSPRPESEP